MSVCWRQGHSSSVLARERKGKNLLLDYHLVYLLEFAFVHILGWAAIFNKGLGVRKEVEGMRKHVPKPK